jgi:DNA-binding MarR family transcriptional regulator
MYPTIVNQVDDYTMDLTLSTKLTTSSRAGYSLVDSRALKLVRDIGDFREMVIGWLVGQLKKDGFDLVTPRHLLFLGELDCGTNHAAELARKLGVTRQAIHKSVAELERHGWLESGAHPLLGNQKTIVFTHEGERMMAAARTHFAALDVILLDRIGAEPLATLESALALDLPE